MVTACVDSKNERVLNVIMSEFPPVSFFQSQLSTAYINHEMNLLISSDRQGFDQIREGFDRTLSEITERGIFKYVPGEDDRRTMREGALNVAKDFWIKKLEEPGLSSKAINLGKERIIEINQKLQELAKLREDFKS